MSGQKSGPVAWSVMVPTYRPDALLRETLLSARESLATLGEPWQLEVVDDASPDVNVGALLKSWGLDDVPVHRREVNGGLGVCWNHCVQRARGRFIHILHQDDLVRPAFYRRMNLAAKRFPDAGMLFCRTEFMESAGPRLDQLEREDEGLLDDWLHKISSGQRLQCPSVVIRRDVYDRIGGYDTELRYVIDWVMWVRVAAAVPVAYVPDALAVYRIHEGAETQRVKSAGVVTIDAARGMARLIKILRDAGRRDCLRVAARYALWVSSAAASDAQRASQPETAAREIATALRHLGRFMSPRQFLRQVRTYLHLKFR